MGYENIAVPFRGWTVIREIGIGGFGKVYEIRRDRYGMVEQSAMKVIAVPQNPNEIKSYLRDGYGSETLRKMYDGSRASVLGEYQTMARLKDCPNIVRCDDIEIVMDPDGIGSKIYIRMELLTPIREYEKLLSFNEEEVVKLGSDICNMLVRCEEEGIVHRDIKPENIMVSDRGDYKLGDFGIARSMDHTTMATRIGTINYMAPEVYLGRKYGRAADIYSLGLVLYWLLNNRRMPFFPQEDSLINDHSAADAQEMRMIGTPIPRPVNGSPGLTRAVLKALSYDPADRFQSALEFGNEIRNCLPAGKPSERSHIGENDSTERFSDCENETTEEYSQNTADVDAETAPLDKDNEQRRQYEEERTNEEVRETGTGERAANLKDRQKTKPGSIKAQAETVKIIPGPGDEDEQKNVRLRKIEEYKAKQKGKIKELKEKEESNRLEREGQAEERRIADEKEAGKRKRTIIAIVASIIVAFVVLLSIQQYKEAVENQQYKEAVEKYGDSIKAVSVGGTIKFGHYEQDNNSTNGKEEIEWIVLARDGDRVLVISKYALDCQQYNSSFTSVTWESCSLRKWMNGEFLETAFDSGEQKLILDSTVKAGTNPTYDTSPGNGTTDKVFLLSINETNNYFSSDSARQCQGTAYFYAKIVYNGNSWWWLRSPGYTNLTATYVHYDGSVDAYGSDVYHRGAVRPALWINLGS